MKKISKMFISLYFVFIHVPLGGVLANDLFNQNLYELIISTPEFIEAKQNVDLTDFEIELVKKQTGPRFEDLVNIKIYKSGGLGIF